MYDGQRMVDVNHNGSLIRDINALLNMDWHVQVSHIYREANYAVGFYGCLCCKLPSWFSVIIVTRISDILFNDHMGAAVRGTVVV